MLYKASAPGSLMLMGEYAVLHDNYALVAAIDKRVTVTLQPRRDQKFFIISALGEYAGDLSDFAIVAPFQFVLAAIRHFLSDISSGFELKIESEFLHTIGLGSSAAVTVAMTAVLAAWLNLSMTQQQLMSAARAIIQSVQGVGSGADVAGSVMGGIVAYRKELLFAETILESVPLTVVYSGYKTPTVQAIDQVKKTFAQNTERFQNICNEINNCVVAGIAYVKNKDLAGLGRAMKQQQVWMNELGVNTPELKKIIDTLQQQPGILGAKISGSGLGDCVIGLGDINNSLVFEDPRIQTLPVNVTSKRVLVDSDTPS